MSIYDINLFEEPLDFELPYCKEIEVIVRMKKYRRRTKSEDAGIFVSGYRGKSDSITDFDWHFCLMHSAN